MPTSPRIAAAPKAELHLHVEGTLEPEMVFDLARRNRVEVPFADVDTLRRAHRFADLASFLTLYYDCMAVLRTEQDFHDLAAAYLRRAHADGVVHVEMFFDPQAHTARGVPLAQVVRGLASAAREARVAFAMSVSLIACFLRDRGADEAMRTLEQLAGHTDDLVAVGLDSAEVGYPPKDFADVFAAAAGLGLHRVAHAGEEGPPDYVWQALDVLGVERIDHGIRCVEDAALLRRLAADRTPLTVCPLSNVRLRCVETMAEHPLPRMLDAGLLVTLNSDDPAYFGGYLDANYAAVQDAFALTDDDLAALAAGSLDAAFGGERAG
nr:adenosine deaminase [Jatrophihabitans endophyticus]